MVSTNHIIEKKVGLVLNEIHGLIEKENILSEHEKNRNILIRTIGFFLILYSGLFQPLNS